MPTGMVSEKRRYPRVNRNLDLRYLLFDDSEANFIYSRCEDIGHAGMRFDSRENVPVGQRLKISIRESDQDEWSPEVDGIVVWQDLDGPSSNRAKPTGVFFSSDQVVFGHLIKRLLGDRGIANQASTEIGISVEPAYDGSKATFKLLRIFGWGPLNNLGYFRYPAPFDFMNLVTSFLSGKINFLLPDAQRRLVINAIRLAKIKEGDKVLDIACGKGMSSFLMASMYPKSFVTGADLLPRNVNAANSLYGGAHNLRFLTDNAMDLGFGENTIDKAFCIEAAFHFPDRGKFLQETYRVLKPGGKLVLVDFMWKTAESRLLKGDAKADLVKSEWQWDDFSTISEYKKEAKLAGFEIENERNWSVNVTGPLGITFKSVTIFGNIPFFRKILLWLNPSLKCLTLKEWEALLKSWLAHDYVRRRTEYTAMVLLKK